MHFNDVLSLAARAWHETKPASDPEFNDCALTHRENLGAAAKAVVDSGQAFSEFDRVVLRLYLADKEAKSEADRILAENPTLHGDEVMHIASGTPHPLAGGHAESASLAAVREEFRGIDSDAFAVEPSASLHAVGTDKGKVSVETQRSPKKKPTKKKATKKGNK